MYKKYSSATTSIFCAVWLFVGSNYCAITYHITFRVATPFSEYFYARYWSYVFRAEAEPPNRGNLRGKEVKFPDRRSNAYRGLDGVPIRVIRHPYYGAEIYSTAYTYIIPQEDAIERTLLVNQWVKINGCTMCHFVWKMHYKRRSTRLQWT